MPVVSASGLQLFYGHMEIFSKVTFQVGERAHIGIVGPNGAGKTSLLRILVGDQTADAGTINVTRGARVAYVPQVPPAATTLTLEQELATAFTDLKQMEADLQNAAEEMADGAHAAHTAQERYAELLEQFDNRGGHTYPERLKRVAAGLGLTREILDTPANAASGGERTRAALAKALLSEPDLLILDEPTNHLDLAGLTWLEGFLAHLDHAFVVVSHDRYFLDRVVNETWEMDNGGLRSYPGNYTKYLVLKRERELRESREFEKQQEYIAKEEDFIRRYGAGQRAQEAQGRATRLARLERMEAPIKTATLKIQTSTGDDRAALVVLQTRGLQVGFESEGEPRVLFEIPDVSLERGIRIGIIGPNGIGKTTLLRTLLGVSPPLGGAVAFGGNVEPAYYRQGLEDLPRNLTVIEALREIKAMSEQEARRYLARFLFRGEDVLQQVETLSGGERSRLALARLLVARPNMLILDEPTNHLDIPSREALEQVLLEYTGTLLFVSHDRHLVALLAQQLWIIENGKVRIFRGGFKEWEAQQAAPAPKPQRAQEAPRTKPAPKKKVTPQQDFEQLIAALEVKLEGVAKELQIAAERQDRVEVRRLSAAHNDLRSQLEKKWSEWAAGSPAK